MPSEDPRAREAAPSWAVEAASSWAVEAAATTWGPVAVAGSTLQWARAARKAGPGSGGGAWGAEEQRVFLPGPPHLTPALWKGEAELGAGPPTRPPEAPGGRLRGRLRFAAGAPSCVIFCCLAMLEREERGQKVDGGGVGGVMRRGGGPRSEGLLGGPVRRPWGCGEAVKVPLVEWDFVAGGLGKGGRLQHSLLYCDTCFQYLRFPDLERPSTGRRGWVGEWEMLRGRLMGVGASRITSSSEKEISASADVLFLLTEVVVLPTGVSLRDSDATEGSSMLGGLGVAKVPEQTCLLMQLLCIIREQVSLGQGRQPALSLVGQ